MVVPNMVVLKQVCILSDTTLPKVEPKLLLNMGCPLDSLLTNGMCQRGWYMTSEGRFEKAIQLLGTQTTML